jgi:transposase
MNYYGIDIHTRKSNYCALDESGEEIGTANFLTTKKAFTHHFGKIDKAKIAIEAGAHSHWIAELLKELGHDVVVANPRRVGLIAKNREKDDQTDAELLARLVRTDPRLLHGTHTRSAENLILRGMIKSRSTLVECRTKLINSVRGIVKPFGIVIPRCNSEQFHEVAINYEPISSGNVKAVIAAMLVQIGSLTKEIDFQTKAIEGIEFDDPTITRFKTVPGIGNLIALAYVAYIDDPNRFGRSEQVGKYLGLSSGRRFSGGGGHTLGITKEGDPQMRALMLQAAYAFMRSKKDSELKQWTVQLMARKGGKDSREAKKKTATALARKLGVLLHRIWITGEKFEPFYHTKRKEAAIANK